MTAVLPTRRVSTAFAVRAPIVAMLVGGLLFLLYQAFRPYRDETVAADTAISFASSAWILSHLAAMIAFALVGYGLLAVRARRSGRWSGAPAALFAVGTAAVLPYYGAESFALQAAGRAAQAGTVTDLVGLSDAVRNGSLQTVMFGAGLLLMAAAGVLVAVVVGRSGWLFAAAFVLFLPQFFGPPWLRVVHGLLTLIGCLLLGASQWRTPLSVVDENGDASVRHPG